MFDVLAALLEALLGRGCLCLGLLNFIINIITGTFINIVIWGCLRIIIQDDRIHLLFAYKTVKIIRLADRACSWVGLVG